MGSWVPGTPPPPFSLKMQDFASFFEIFPGEGPPEPTLEGHRHTRRLCIYTFFAIRQKLTQGIGHGKLHLLKVKINGIYLTSFSRVCRQIALFITVTHFPFFSEKPE